MDIRHPMLRGTALLLASCVMVPAAARAPVRPESSEALRPVLACREVPAAAERLACYDRAAAALQEASARKDIVVVDSQAIAKTRRSLFGFSVPDLDIFKGRTDQPEQSEISSTVRVARQDAAGNWIITLEDGAIWHQTSGVVGGSVRAGEKVVIKRATLGSFFMRLGNRPGVRARREG